MASEGPLQVDTVVSFAARGQESLNALVSVGVHLIPVEKRGTRLAGEGVGGSWVKRRLQARRRSG